MIRKRESQLLDLLKIIDWILSDDLFSKNLNIVGIFDPEDHDLSIDMWINSNGSKILEIIEKIQN